MTQMDLAAEDIASNAEDDLPEMHMGELLTQEGDDGDTV